MKRPFVVLIVLVLLSFAAYGCNRREQVRAKEQNQELKTYKVSTREVTSYIDATGSVQPDLEGTSKIQPFLPGTVQRIFVKAGDSVKKGDPLVAVVSPEVTDTYSGYLSALSQLSQAERIYNLNTQLFEVG